MATSTDKQYLPTATVLEHRLGFFQPTRRPVYKKQNIVTPWGKIHVEGRLGQQHANVFESICYERERRADMEDGRIKLLIDPAKVRARAGITSGEQFTDICNELQTFLLQIIEPVEKACSGHLVDHIDAARRIDGSVITRHNPLGGERPMWKVELGKAFCKLVEADVWIGHDPAIIVGMRYGISQAVTRHLLTHKDVPNGGWIIDNLISAVAGGQLSSTSMRHRRHELRQDADAIAAAGYIINKDGRIVKK